MGGIEPARRLVLEAIAAAKDVVTANKALLAVHGREIFRAAERAGVEIGFEASVGGGIPIIRTLKEGLAGDRNRAIYGIVNGTSQLHPQRDDQQGGEFTEALPEAQTAGLAEADPSFDVDGIDAAHKLTLLVQLAFGRASGALQIRVEGIRHVSQLDIELRARVRLRDQARWRSPSDDGERSKRASTRRWCRARSLLADVRGAFNAIARAGRGARLRACTSALGAGMMPTATAVRRRPDGRGAQPRSGSRGRVAPLGKPLAHQRRGARVRPIEDLDSEYYLRFMVVDRPGVLGRDRRHSRPHEISIASVIQKDREHGTIVPIVIRTHDALERNLRRALAEIDRLAVVQRQAGCIVRHRGPAVAGLRGRLARPSAARFSGSCEAWSLQPADGCAARRHAGPAAWIGIWRSKWCGSRKPQR